MDNFDFDEPTVQNHLDALIGISVAVVILACVRFRLVCRTHTDTKITKQSKPLDRFSRSWAVYYCKQICEQIWLGQTILLFITIAVVIVVSVALNDINSLFDAIQEVATYPKIVHKDLQSLTPNGNNNVCVQVISKAKNLTLDYEVPNFQEVDNFVHLLWLAVGIWAGIVGLYLVSTRFEPIFLNFFKDVMGFNFCGGGRLQRICCIGGISSIFMWSCTFVFVIVMLASRAAVMVGCDYVDLPEDAMYLFDENSVIDHPFLDTVKDNLEACANDATSVLRHLEPGVLSPQLATLYNVCDNLEDALLSLIVLATLIFPLTVFAAAIKQFGNYKALDNTK